MAVARTGSPTGAHRTGSHSSAFSVTIPADADCVVLDLMATHFTTCQGATGVTCDGVAMTLVSGTDAGSMAFGAPCRHQSWVIIAPNTGTVNITPTFGGTGGVSRSHLAVQFYTGVDQTTPTEGGYASGRITSPTGGTKTFAPTTTTVADDYLICGYHNFGSGVGDIDADGVDIYESYDSNNGTIFGTADKLLTGSGQNMGWTDLTFYDYAGHVFVLKASAGGGTTHDALITEAITAIESASAQAGFSSAITESAAAAEASSAQAVFNVAIAETATAAEASTSNIITSAAIAESITAIDASLSNISTASAIDETGTASESSDATITNNPAVIETVTAAEASTVQLAGVASITEAATADSAQTNTLVTSATIAETGSLSEASVASYITNGAAAETTTASDEQDGTVTIAELEVEVTEVLSASDETSIQIAANAEIVEAVEANDASFSGSIFSALMEEILNATDSSTVVYKLVKRVVDGALQIREVGSSLVKRVFARNLTERNPEDF